MSDREIEAMQGATKLFDPLESDELLRVLTWINQKYSFKVSSSLEVVTSESSANETNQTEWFATFGEFYHAADPKSEKEKALTAAYWVQVQEGEDSFASQTLNTYLKDLGYGVANITDALSQLMKERPALVIQLRKSGASRQARKTYKLTDAGKRRLLQMIDVGDF